MLERFKRTKGHTLIELMAALLIASIITWAFYKAYVDGLVKFNNMTSKQVMLSEGSTKLRFIEFLIRRSYQINVTDSNSPLRSRVELRIPSESGQPYYEIFANRVDGTLRIHDAENNKFNRRLLPQTRFSGGGPDDHMYPYRVKEFWASYADEEIYEDFDDMPLNLNGILKLSIVLADYDGNEVTLSTYQSRFN